MFIYIAHDCPLLVRVNSSEIQSVRCDALRSDRRIMRIMFTCIAAAGTGDSALDDHIIKLKKDKKGGASKQFYQCFSFFFICFSATMEICPL